MAKREEYELLPHQVLMDFKNEVELLKKKLSEPDTKSQELILEMESLKDSIAELTTIFKKALEDVRSEDVYGKMGVLQEKVDAVVSQNETIARGMIAISDKLEDFMKRQGVSLAPFGGVQHTLGVPPAMMAGPARMAPKPMMEMPGVFTPPMEMAEPGDTDLPPPPPSGRRKGIFG